MSAELKCQGVITSSGFRCFCYESKANWRPCCDIAEADEQLDRWRNEVEQGDPLLSLSAAERYYRLVSAGRLSTATRNQLVAEMSHPPYSTEEL
jgi:hypothetical protein